MPSRLKSLELLGYKTFATKSQFLFGEKITAVVGPNGSGKSNIADSIRWVLGEQSFSLLRGKKTEDMIFAGSELRARASMAQATVTFDNSDGWLPIDFSEVSIGRRAYRDGSNEYLLNGQKTRLRDIAELLGKVGLAERTYTIIGQGLVDNALSLKSEERRALFEEAAGITIYRGKRDETIRRLDETQRNLERVHDILSEIRPRLKTLERQAARAKEYQQIKTELDGVLKVWYGYHWHEGQKALTFARASAEAQATALAELQRTQSTLDKALTETRARAASVRSQLSLWQRDLLRLRGETESFNRKFAVADERLRSFAEQRETLTQELTALEKDHATQLAQLNQVRSELAHVESEYENAKAQVESLEATRTQREAERKSLATRQLAARDRLTQLSNEIEQKRSRRVQIAEERQGLIKTRNEVAASLEQSQAVTKLKRESLLELEAKANAARSKLDQNESNINELTQRVSQADAELALFATRLTDAITEEERLTARAEALAQLRADLERERSAIGLLKEKQIAIQGELTDIIITQPEHEAAIAAALGSLINTLVVEDINTALDVLAQAQTRASLLSLAELRPTPLELPTDFSHPDLIGIASSLVTCDARYRPAVEALLGRVIIMRTRESAKQIATRLPIGACAVTSSGEVFYANGVILGGRDSLATALTLAREQRTLPVDIDNAKGKRIVLELERSKRDSELRLLREQWNAANNARRELGSAERETATARDAGRLEMERAEAEVRSRTEQLAALESQIAKSNNDDAAFASEINSLSVSLAEAESATQTLATQTFGLTVDDLTERLAQTQTASAVAARAAADAQARAGEMSRALDRVTELITSRRARISTLASEAESFSSSLIADRAQLDSLNVQIDDLLSKIEPAEKDLAQIESELTRVEGAEGDARTRLHTAERFNSEAQLEFARKTDELEALRRRITDDFGLVTLDYPEGMLAPEPLPLEGLVETLPHVDELPEGMEDLLNRRRSQLRRIGLTNPDALKEFEEVKERHEFLTTQVDDLKQAEAQLREVIAELDTLMEREFKRTFEAVGEQFKETFSRLFGGGTAKLLLTEPDDITNTGIDILARLPGRKQQGLALLSGGERALTACALVFALLRVNPPPFAMLDEVDAALDEANVGRFRDLLIELSKTTQFVVITHNRNTVQSADTVYGISMGADSASQAISLKLDGENVPSGN